MIILSDSGFTLSNPLWLIGAIIVGFVLFVYILGVAESYIYDFKEAKTWLILLVLGILLTICIYFTIKTAQKTYKIYLQDMTLNELETEYEVRDVDGLILECTRKEM